MRKTAVSLLIAGLLFSGCAVDSSESKDEETAAKAEEGLQYHIRNVEHRDVDDAKRPAYHVVVEDEAPGENTLKRIAMEVAETAKEDHPFNALWIGFYGGYEEKELGYAVLAPNGEWTAARNVKTGQYDRMEFSYNLFPSDQQATEKEREKEKKFDLAEGERRVLFKEILQAEERAWDRANDVYPPTESIPRNISFKREMEYDYKSELAKRYGLTVSDLEEIRSEGIENEWDMPDW